MDIFCEIAQHKKEATILYEDEDICAFLDIEPFTTGHTLIIPKQHFDDIHSLPKTIQDCIYAYASIRMKELKEKYNYREIKIFHMPSIKEQEIDHFHLHILGK